ncbi:SUMO protein smt3 [Malassezia equina]|uniref:SUMO protein smt3 n=1 Tax=Malassezia equina TaxID=1381935 RepID=A0AAF0IZA6_9BASI|nr:SUMO protein smt3 [Malassezia equina]
MSEETVPKPEVAPEQLNIKVKDAEGNEVFFKVKRTTKLAKLKRAYAERMGKPENSVRFIFDGQRVGDDDTAESLDMNDQDEIDAMIEQLGGAPRC